MTTGEPSLEDLGLRPEDLVSLAQSSPQKETRNIANKIFFVVPSR